LCSPDEMGRVQEIRLRCVRVNLWRHRIAAMGMRADTETQPNRAHIEPGWHAWISYAVDQPPTEDRLLLTKQRRWETPVIVPNLTATPGAYKPYNTWVLAVELAGRVDERNTDNCAHSVKPKIYAWKPEVAERVQA
jgi:NADH:ubiquinone oxidoreductase subunit